MTFSFKRFSALLSMKIKTMLSNKNMWLPPLMALFFVYAMKFVLPDASGSEETVYMQGFLLVMGIVFNVMMGGMMMASYPLAEEKEKHTLRVLMTSSVSNLEFFLASLIPPLLVISLVNVLLVPLAGHQFGNFPLGTYLILTTICTLISLMTGLIIGLVAESQMQASMISLPFMLVFSFVPMFMSLNKQVAAVAKYLYSGVLVDFLLQINPETNYQWTVQNILILAVWASLATVIFMIVYRKNGLDH